jgi:uncharacterized protein YxeA
MKKNIAIVVLLLISVLSVAFAYYQRALTDRAVLVAEAYELKALEAANEAMRAAAEADQQRMLADQNAVRALEAQMIAEQLVKTRKK